MIYFISDEHYYHSNILSFRTTTGRPQRPFKTLAEMHDTIIGKHNDLITNQDFVYHLGDFAFTKSWRDVENILKRLKGTHSLILGNHDHLKPFDYVEAGFQSVHTSLVLPQGNWNLIHDPAIAGVIKDKNWIHGHTHGLGKRLSDNSWCVSVEVTDYAPIKLSQIMSGEY